MEERLITLVKENTKRDNYEDNNASNLSNIIGLSRNSISSYLNDYFNQGRFVKINTRPVLFLEKSELEKRYNIKINKLMFASLDELDEYAKTCGRGSKDFRDLIGYNGSLRKIIESCKASISYPPHGLPILLNGPTGTGKSFIIEKMFEYGKNNGIFSEKAKFVHVNCSEYANNPELITANLFGYKRGAFTGADNDNPGLIKVADGGMLFLDEVHCLKPECQEKLFLFMDKGNYHVLGDSENEYHSNVFLAFATTENPKEVLLKTLLRRIPIQMEIPSLSKRSEMEKSNIITVAWTGILNTNPAKVYISVRPTRYSYNLIKENREFVINLTNKQLAKATDWCGVKTGAKVDKFKEMKLHKEKANFVKCPMIKESPVSVECRVTEIKELGSHHMFVADVLSINADEKYIDERGAFDISKCDLIAYSNGHYYSLGKKIGKFGYSVQKRKNTRKKAVKKVKKC